MGQGTRCSRAGEAREPEVHARLIIAPELNVGKKNKEASVQKVW